MVKQERLVASLHTVIKGGVLVILFLPLIVNSAFFFPFIVFKNVVFRIAVELIFGCYLVLAALRPEYRPRWDRLVIATLVFFGVSVISGLLGIGAYRSIWGNYERMSGLFHQLHLILYFIVLVHTFRTKRDWHMALTFSVFASILMSFLAFAQYLQIPFILKSAGGSRLSGSVGNATFLAAYLLFNLFFILYFLVDPKRFDLKTFALSFISFDIIVILMSVLYGLYGPDKDITFFGHEAQWLNFLKTPLLNQARQYGQLLMPFIGLQLAVGAAWYWQRQRGVIRALLVVLFCFDFFIFFHTQTRGALIGFTLGILLLALGGLALTTDRRIKIGSGIVIVLLLLAPFVLVAAKNTPIVQRVDTLRRLAGISLNDITTESRLLTWQASWQGWSATPRSFLIGYGPENYYYAFNKNFPAVLYKDTGSQVWFDKAHNFIFDIGVTTGIIGFISYLAMLGLAVWYLYVISYRSKRFDPGWLFIGLIAAYLVQNVFVFDTLNSEVILYAVLAFIVFLYHEQSTSEAESKSGSTATQYVPAAIIGVAVMAGLFLVNVQTLRANHLIFRALVSEGSAHPVEAFTLLKRSINEGIIGRFEVREQLANFVDGTLRSSKTLTKNQAQEMVDEATTQLEASIKEEPQNVRQYLVTGVFLNSTAQFSLDRSRQAIEYLNQAIPLSPTRQAIYTELSRSYFILGQPGPMVENMDKAIALSPKVIQSHWDLLIAAVLIKRDDIVEREMQALRDLKWDPFSADYLFTTIASAYIQIKDVPQAIALYESMVDQDGITTVNRGRYYAELAALYAKIGDTKRAEAAVKKAVELDPTNAQGAQVFLDKLHRGELKEQ